LSVVEIERLMALRSQEVLDTPAEEAFDRLTRLASELFETPICAVSLVDEDRQWFKSQVGLSISETPRSMSFCDHAIRGDDVMVVSNAPEDDRFADNPLVTGAPHIRFYAGAPLRLKSGHKLGALCVIDTEPREGLTDAEKRRLETLAKVVVDELELRLVARHLNQAKAEAELATRAKAEFLATMTHELRSPLTSIIGFSGMLNASGLLEGRDKHFAERIQFASSGLLALVNDVLDLGKLEAGAVEIIRQPVELQSFLRDVTSLFTLQTEAKGVGLRLEIDLHAPQRVETDASWLQQILTNLLSNAVKFTDRGEIVVYVTQKADALAFRVEDTGPGIPAERLERVFEQYEQADRSIAKRYGGTGLGLAISRRLAEALGGALVAESVVGQGSAFTLSLPLSRVGEASATAD